MHDQKPVHYITTLNDVREVMLSGYADLGYWTKHLAGSPLLPLNRSGQAEMLLSATDSRYMGRPFNELSVSVAVCQAADPSQQTGFYLAYAFNSSAMFAFIERFMFKTPYYQGRIQLENRVPALMQVKRKNDLLLQAGMNAERSHVPTQSLEEDWQGRIYLAGGRHYFLARLAGLTQIYPFLEGQDNLEITPGGNPGLTWLKESNFTPHEWRIRARATHSKSDTY